jgi:hypothetical protein
MSIVGSGEYVPQRLKYLVNRLENFRVQHLKLTAESTSTAASGDKITFNLPSQGLANLESFTLSGKCEAVTNAAVLPMNGVSGLISRIDVSAGGVVISSCQNYNQLHQVLRQWTIGRTANRQQSLGGGVGNDSALSVGGDELVAPFIHGTFGSLTATPTAAEVQDIVQASAAYQKAVQITAGSANSIPFNLSSWLDFLGMEQGYVLDLATIPAPLQIQITLDTSRVLGKTAAGATDFKLTDLYAKLDVIEFPLMSRAIMAMLNAGETISVPFTRYLSYSFANASGAGISNRFSVASQCLSKLWINNVKSDFYTQDTAADGRNQKMFVSDADSSSDYWCEIDNRRTATYNINLKNEGYDWCKCALGARHADYDNLYTGMGGHATATNANGNVAAYGTYNYFNSAFSLVFNFGYADWDADSNANVSGYNSQGLSSAVVVNATTGNQSADHTQNIWAETKAVLNIQRGRVISVDY